MSDAPTVDVLLGVDREYRDKALAGVLPQIAPYRFIGDEEVSLPVLHSCYGPWHVTALFSNSDDWVVIFFSDDHGEDGQLTVMTEGPGTLAGKRVVRGREAECARYYAAPAVPKTERATSRAH